MSRTCYKRLRKDKRMRTPYASYRIAKKAKRYNDLFGGNVELPFAVLKAIINKTPIGKIIKFVEKSILKLFTIITIALKYKQFGIDEKEYFSAAKFVGSSKSKIFQILDQIKAAIVKGKASVLIYLLETLKGQLKQIVDNFEKLKQMAGSAGFSFGEDQIPKSVYIAWAIIKKIDFAINLLKVEVSRKLHPKNFTEEVLINRSLDRMPSRLRRRRDSLYNQIATFFKNIKILFMHAKNGYVSDSLVGLGALVTGALVSLKGYVANLVNELKMFLANYEFVREPSTNDTIGQKLYQEQQYINESSKMRIATILKDLKQAIITTKEAESLVSRMKKAASNVKIKDLLSKLLLKIGQSLDKLKTLFSIAHKASKASDAMSMSTALAPIYALSA